LLPVGFILCFAQPSHLDTKKSDPLYILNKYSVLTSKRDAQAGRSPIQVEFLNLPRETVVKRLTSLSLRDLQNPLGDDTTIEQDQEAVDMDVQELAEQGEESALVEDEEEERDQEDLAEDDSGGQGDEKARGPPAPSTTTTTTQKRLRLTSAEAELRKLLKKEHRLRKLEMLNHIKSWGADSLLIASPHDCWEALEALLPSLGLGMPFVVHSPTVEPLMKCRARLVGLAIAVQVTETFCREIQVLPQRTHPLVTSSATGGFILRGVKIAKAP